MFSANLDRPNVPAMLGRSAIVRRLLSFATPLAAGLALSGCDAHRHIDRVDTIEVGEPWPQARNARVLNRKLVVACTSPVGSTAWHIATCFERNDLVVSFDLGLYKYSVGINNGRVETIHRDGRFHWRPTATFH